MTNQQTAIKGRVDRISSSGRSFYVDNVWYTLSNDHYGPVPIKGDVITLTFSLWTSNDGQKRVRYIDNWELCDETFDQPPINKETTRQIKENDNRRDDKPVVTRLACLNAAIATYGHFYENHTTTDANEAKAFILGIAEEYAAWTLWGGNAKAKDTTNETGGSLPELPEQDGADSSGDNHS